MRASPRKIYQFGNFLYYPSIVLSTVGHVILAQKKILQWFGPTLASKLSDSINDSLLIQTHILFPTSSRKTSLQLIFHVIMSSSRSCSTRSRHNQLRARYKAGDTLDFLAITNLLNSSAPKNRSRTLQTQLDLQGQILRHAHKLTTT